VQAQERFQYSQQIARSVGIVIPPEAFRRSLSVMQYRAGSFRLFRSHHPIPGDSRMRIALDCLRASRIPQGRSRKEALAITVWVLMVQLLPLPAARMLIAWKYNPASRPQALRTWLGRLGVLRLAG